MNSERQARHTDCRAFSHKILSEYLRDSCFTGSWLSTNKDSPSSNLSFSNHTQDDTSSTSSFDLIGWEIRNESLSLEILKSSRWNFEQETYLSNHTLRYLSWVKWIIETKTSDMRVSTNTLNSSQIFDFLDLWMDSRCWHPFVLSF